MHLRVAVLARVLVAFGVFAICVSAAPFGSTLAQGSTPGAPITPRRVVVFVPGIATDLTSNQVNPLVDACESPSADPTFGFLKQDLVLNYGFTCADFLNYSYKPGGDFRNGRFYPAPYQPVDTGQSLQRTSVPLLGSLLATYQQRIGTSQPVELIVVGHSLGGVIALDYARIVAVARQGGRGTSFPNVVAAMTIDSPILGISSADAAAARKLFRPFAQFPITQFTDFGRLISNSTAADEVIQRWDDSSWNDLAARLADQGILSYSIGNQYDCLWRPWECGIPREWSAQQKQWLLNWDLQTRNTQRLPGSDGPDVLPGVPLQGVLGGGPCQAWVGGLTQKDAGLDTTIGNATCIRDRHSDVTKDKPGNWRPTLASWISTLGRRLSVGDASITEGNTGLANMTFTVTRGGLNSTSARVNYQTDDGTATTLSGDYARASGTLIFAAGETSKVITVAVNGDVTVEPDETLFVNLSGATNATIAKAQGVGTIRNDDLPTVSIADAGPVLEGSSGTIPALFRVTLSPSSRGQVTVALATADGTATAASGDYASTTGTLTFAPGETIKTISVSVNGDTRLEPDETFFVNLSNPTNASIVNAQGIGTIVNDDLATSVPITEYRIPTTGGTPYGITAGPDGALWFTEQYGNKIGRITTSGTITEYSLPTLFGQPGSITAGSDGALWFTYNAYNPITGSGSNSIGRITTGGAVTLYPAPRGATAITSGPDGALWFTAGVFPGEIVRMTTSGAATEYPIANPGYDMIPGSITVGPDGALWFGAETGFPRSGLIGRITTGGSIDLYPVQIGVGSGLHGITTGPDGALWFTGYTTTGSAVGRITTDAIEYPQDRGVGSMALGTDGAFWFTASGPSDEASSIVRWTPEAGSTESVIPTNFSRPTDIFLGPDGALWFTEAGGDRIGRISPSAISPAPTPTVPTPTPGINGIIEYSIPGTNSPVAGVNAAITGRPEGIVVGPDGALWFTESGAGGIDGKIDRITPNGIISGYRLPTFYDWPSSIAAGSDGALWFTENGYNPVTGESIARIGRITTTGGIFEYFQYANDITAGPDGALWFTANAAIGRITTSGVITEYPIPSGSRAMGITTGPDNALWFTEQRDFSTSGIGRITTGGAITEFPPPAGGLAGPITAGPDGALWFTENSAGMIGRMTTTGVITQFPIPPTISAFDITSGPDGALWMTVAGGIGRLTTSGSFTHYSIPTTSNRPNRIVAGPDNALWFTEIDPSGGNGAKIGRIPVAPTLTNTTGSTPALSSTSVGTSLLVGVTPTPTSTVTPTGTPTSVPGGTAPPHTPTSTRAPIGAVITLTPPAR